MSLNSLFALTMRRGVQAHVDLIKKLLEGMEVPDADTLVILDLSPNRCPGQLSKLRLVAEG